MLASVRFAVFLSSCCLLAGSPASAAHADRPHDRQLARLIAELRAHHPRLAGWRARGSGERARATRMGALPDPQVRYRRFLATPETRVGPQRQSIELSQRVPWRSERRLAVTEASRLAEASDLERQSEERDLIADLEIEYFEVAYLQDALATNLEERRLLERFEQTALTRYSTGDGIQQSVIKVQTDLTRLADRRIALEQQLEARSIRIAELIGRSESTVRLDPIRLSTPPSNVRPETPGGAVDDHPSLAASRERISSMRAALDRGRLVSRPDLSFSLGWVDVGRRSDPAAALGPPPDDGKDVWSLSVGLNLPVRGDRNRATVDELNSAVDAETYRLEDLRNRTESRIRRVETRLRAIEERERLYEEVLIPQAEQSLASAEAAYRTGGTGFLDLLDAQRVLFDVRLGYQRLVADLWIALAELERDAGASTPAGERR